MAFQVNWRNVATSLIIQNLMKSCDERDELRRRLATAFEEWYAVKDVPGKNREAEAAEKKVHHIQRSLGDHVAKHACNRD
jgi:hypothetical protein